jgi:hypothetical protein
LSPMLFNLVADMLATHCTSKGRWSGRRPNSTPSRRGISIFEYADDMIIFWNIEKALNMKLI